MLEPGTKVKIRDSSIVRFLWGKSGVVVAPKEDESYPDSSSTIIVRVNENPDWEDWEPSEDNEYYFREDELEIVKDGD